MKYTFDEYFEWLMKWEGETYENDPDDAGGETKFGIDKRSHPEINIRKLTRDHAKQIYFDDYWTPVRAPALPPKLAWVMADIAVNNGRTRAVKWLQGMLVKTGIKVDGVFGPKTMGAVQQAKRIWEDDLMSRMMLDRRENFYKEIATGKQRKFLKGWLNRNNDLRKVLDL